MPKVLFFFFFSLFISSCSENPKQQMLQGEIYGTTWQIKYFPKDEVSSDFIQSIVINELNRICLLYTSPSPRDVEESRMPSSA